MLNTIFSVLIVYSIFMIGTSTVEFFKAKMDRNFSRGLYQQIPFDMPMVSLTFLMGRYAGDLSSNDLYAFPIVSEGVLEGVRFRSLKNCRVVDLTPKSTVWLAHDGGEVISKYEVPIFLIMVKSHCGVMRAKCKILQ